MKQILVFLMVVLSMHSLFAYSNEVSIKLPGAGYRIVDLSDRFVVMNGGFNLDQNPSVTIVNLKSKRKVEIPALDADFTILRASGIVDNKVVVFNRKNSGCELKVGLYDINDEMYVREDVANTFGNLISNVHYDENNLYFLVKINAGVIFHASAPDGDILSKTSYEGLFIDAMEFDRKSNQLIVSAGEYEKNLVGVRDSHCGYFYVEPFKSSGLNLYKISSSGMAEKLTNGKWFDFSPKLSPDGGKVLYLRGSLTESLRIQALVEGYVDYGDMKPELYYFNLITNQEYSLGRFEYINIGDDVVWINENEILYVEKGSESFRLVKLNIKNKNRLFFDVNMRGDVIQLFLDNNGHRICWISVDSGDWSLNCSQVMR